jgi:TatD DNase family protein
LGNLVHGRNILPELQGKVDAINVSLNAPDAQVYAKICPSKYKEAAYPEVKKFILEAKKYIPWVQASVVGMPGVDVAACRKVAEEELGVRFRHREYDNVG